MPIPLKASAVSVTRRVTITPSLNITGRSIIVIRRRCPTPNVRPSLQLPDPEITKLMIVGKKE